MNPLILFSVAVFVCISLIGCSSPQKDWDSVQSVGTIPALEGFLKSHKNSRFAQEAQTLLREKYTRRDWATTQLSDTIYAYEEFLRKYPNSRFSEKGLDYLKKLYRKRDWKTAESLNTISGYEDYLDQHPASRFTIQGTRRLMHLYALKDWKMATQLNNLEAYESFVRNHFNSDFTMEAAKRIEQLSEDDKVRKIKKRVAEKSRLDPSSIYFPIFAVQKSKGTSYFVYKGTRGRYYMGSLDGSRKHINGIGLPRLRFASPFEGVVLFVSERDLRKDHINGVMTKLSKELVHTFGLEDRPIKLLFPTLSVGAPNNNGEFLDLLFEAIEDSKTLPFQRVQSRVGATTKRDIVVERLIEDLENQLENQDIVVRQNAATALLFIESKQYYSRSICIQVEQVYGTKELPGEFQDIELPVKPLVARLIQHYTDLNLECSLEGASDVLLKVQLRGEAIGIDYTNYEESQVVYKAASLAGTVYLGLAGYFETTKPFTGYVNNAPQHLLVPPGTSETRIFHPPQDAPFKDALLESSISQAILEVIGELYGIESIEAALIDEGAKVRIGAADAIKNLMKLGFR